MTPSAPPIEWRIAQGLTPYAAAVAFMEARVDAIANGTAREMIWLVEHPPLYTAGTSAKAKDLLKPDRFPVFETGRGGEYTYHGPGQRVVYVMLDVRRRTNADVRRFVGLLERAVILTLDRFNVLGVTRLGRVGVWVERPTMPAHADGRPREDKIAAIGIRIRRGISYHGLSLNVEPDLTHFTGIVPCGIRNQGVTSLVDLGLPVTITDADIALRASFVQLLGLAAFAPTSAD